MCRGDIHMLSIISICPIAQTVPLSIHGVHYRIDQNKPVRVWMSSKPIEHAKDVLHKCHRQLILLQQLLVFFQLLEAVWMDCDWFVFWTSIAVSIYSHGSFRVNLFQRCHSPNDMLQLFPRFPFLSIDNCKVEGAMCWHEVKLPRLSPKMSKLWNKKVEDWTGQNQDASHCPELAGRIFLRDQGY